MSTATFTVPLTARVLRVILADMEGTGSLLGGPCGCRTEVAAHVAERRYAPEVPTQGELPIKDAGVAITSGIVEQDNPFVVTPPPVPTAAEYFATAPITLPSMAADEALLAAQEPVVFSPGGPVPMPPVTVPAPPVPAPPVTTTTVPLDGEGLPWDGRIHASTKTLRQSDNTWKLKKGADPALVETVKAELRGCMAAPAPAPGVVAALSGSWSPETGRVIGVPAPPVATAPVPPIAGPGSIAPNYSGAQSGGYEPPANPTIAAVATAPTMTAPQPPNATAVVQPPVPAAPVQPEPVVPAAPVSPQPTAITFTDFCTWFTTKMTSGVLVRAQLEKVCADNGITSLPMLQNRPDLVPVIHAALVAVGGE